MPRSQEENRDRTALPQADLQKMLEGSGTPENAASRRESELAADASIPQFRYRVLVVDDEPSVRETAALVLQSKGYEVLTVADGLEGLHALSKSLPDLIISDLNMPRMSGFEFLAIVRTRFPHIATIVVSGEYTTRQDPKGVLADTFLHKGQYTNDELFQEIAKLLAASPIRSEREKSDIAPLFVPRSDTGNLIITCPACLRPNTLAATRLNGGIHQTICQSCRTPVNFEINQEIEPLLKPARRL